MNWKYNKDISIETLKSLLNPKSWLVEVYDGADNLAELIILSCIGIFLCLSCWIFLPFIILLAIGVGITYK